MAFEPKQWKYDDDVTEQELNRIEQGIVEANQKADQNASALAAHLNDKLQDGVHGLATTQNITLYVDAANGDDNNDGLTPQTAVRTIQTALNRVPKIINHSVLIVLADGVYDEDVLITGFNTTYYRPDLPVPNPGAIRLRGNNAQVKSFFIAGNTATVTVEQMTITATADAVYTHSNTGAIWLENITTISSGTYGIRAHSSPLIIVVGSKISNKQTGIFATSLSRIVSRNNTGTGNSVALFANEGSVIAKNGTQPAGTTSEQTANGGVIR